MPYKVADMVFLTVWGTLASTGTGYLWKVLFFRNSKAMGAFDNCRVNWYHQYGRATEDMICMLWS